MTDLSDEMNRSWTLYASGVPLNYDHRLGQLGVDAPPPAAQMGESYTDPMGNVAFNYNNPTFDQGMADLSQSDIPPGERMAPNIDWNDPEAAAQYGTSEMRQWNPSWRGNLVYGTVDMLTGLGMDQDKARTIAERVWGAAGDLGDQIGVIDGAALAAFPFAMGAAPVVSGSAMAAVGAPSLILQTEEELNKIADGIEGIKAGRDGAFGDTAQAIGFTLLNAIGLKQTGQALPQGVKNVMGEAAGYLRDNAGDIAKVAVGVGAAGAVMSPDDAEAGMLSKVARKGKGVITKLGKAEGETATQFVERMNREAPIVTDAETFVKNYGDVPVTDAATPSPAVVLRQAPAGTRDIVPDLPMGQMGESPTAASSFAQVGGYFDSLVRMKNGGQPRMWSDPTHQAEILTESASEIAYQMSLARPNAKNLTRVTGWGWYDEDIVKTFNTAAKTMPELGMQAKRGLAIPWEGGPNMVGNTDRVTPTQARILASAVGAPQSFGNPASRNADIQFQAYEVFRKTGQFPEKGIYLDDAGAVESTGKYWTQRAVSEQYIGVVNTLIREIGPAKAADWLVSEHTIAELRDLKRRAVNAAGEPIFKGDGTMGISGKADEIKQGAFIFGPKGGQFMGNLLGFPGTTTDMWFSRTWNRYMGTSREGLGALSETGLVEQPRNLAERGEMADFSKKLTDQLNLDTAFVQRMGRPMTERDTQAVLWYFEQNLYNDMGIRVKPTSFGEGADAYAKRAQTQGGTGIQRRDSNRPARGAAPPSAATP